MGHDWGCGGEYEKGKKCQVLFEWFLIQGCQTSSPWIACDPFSCCVISVMTFDTMTKSSTKPENVYQICLKCGTILS